MYRYYYMDEQMRSCEVHGDSLTSSPAKKLCWVGRVRKNRIYDLASEVETRCRSFSIKAFTLVELLVVISIIAILASLLLPSLKKARDKGMGIACANTLKQMGIMMSFYNGDNNEYYPWYTFMFNKGGTDYYYSWIAYLAVYTGKFKDIDDALYWYPVPANTTFLESKRKFINFKCPGADWIWVDPVSEGGYALHQCYATNYTGNFSMMGINYSALVRNSIRVTQISKPSKTSPCWDGTRVAAADNSWYIKQVSAGGNPAVDYRHCNSANVLFSDGHVTAFPFSPILPISYRSSPLCLWE